MKKEIVDMNLEKIKLLIKEHAWDARITGINCNYFADEVEICHESSEDSVDVVYKFTGCYRVIFEHVKNYDKGGPMKEITLAELFYALQSIEVSSVSENNINFYTCKIDMFPMNVEIWCKDIEVFKNLYSINCTHRRNLL